MHGVADSFYVPAGDGTWLATVHTTGPWDPGSQHGGPPSALLGREMQRCEPRDDMIIARFTCEILSPIPVGEIAVQVRLARPGRSVQLLEGVITAGGREVALARAWRVLRTSSADAGPSLPPPPALPGEQGQLLPRGWVDGYLSAIEWRMPYGRFGAPGPAAAWARMRYPLLPGEEPSPLERVLAVADSGSGVSGELPYADWVFINPEVTVHLFRDAAGEWVCLDAQTSIAAGGAGFARTVLSDTGGPVGLGTQSLLIVPRPGRPV